MSFVLTQWKLIAIAAMAGLAILFASLWQQEVKAHASYQGEVRAAQQAAEQRAAEIEAHQQEVVRDVSLAWNASLPGVREAAVENYVRRFGGAARLCPGAAPDGLRIDLASAADHVPGPAAAAGVDVRAEPEQLAPDQAAFVRACAEDAQARNMTRETLLRLGFKPEG